jgi:hypothetical protein
MTGIRQNEEAELFEHGSKSVMQNTHHGNHQSTLSAR